MATSYYATRLSDNVGETSEGFIVCANSILGRTGHMEYAAAELPKEVIEALGISDQGAMIQVYRTTEELFSDDSLASLEGKSCLDQHPPSGQFVTKDNVRDLEMGHVQNVHKGEETLDDGNWPLVGDVFIKREPLLSKVKAGQRALSLGYDFDPVIIDGRVTQTNIKYNHLAVVNKARAGPEARIVDAAPVVEPVADPPLPEDPVPQEIPPEPADVKCIACESGECLTHNKIFVSDTKPEDRQTPIRKERMPLNMKRIFGLGLMQAAQAKDADPEEIAEAARQYPSEEKKEEAKDSKAGDRHADDKHADDSHRSDDKHSDDRHADDAAIKHAEDCPCKDCKMTRDRAKDQKAADQRTGDRARHHATLDRMLNDAGFKESKEKELLSGEDADISELKKLLNEYMGEEQGESEHAGDEKEVDPDLVPEESATAEKGRAADRSAILDPSETEQVKAADRKAELEFMKSIKPLVARSTDSVLKKEFNARVRALKGTSVTSDGSYAEIAAAAGKRSTERPRAADSKKPPEDPYADLNAEYEKRRGKPITTEVK